MNEADDDASNSDNSHCRLGGLNENRSIEKDASKVEELNTRSTSDRFSLDVSHSDSTVKTAQRLIAYKKAVNLLLEDNKSYLRSLQRAIGATFEAEKDLSALQSCLDRADAIAEEGKRIDVMPLHAERIQLPLHPSIYKKIPQLASQAEENENFRLLCTSCPWSIDEIARLEKAVLQQCRRVATLQLARSQQCPGNLFEVANKWSKEELSVFSQRKEDEEEAIDWRIISDEMGGAHTLEDCRTRWLMVDRPGIGRTQWDQEEKDRLRIILQSRPSEDQRGVSVDWRAVAKELNTNRLAIDCFAICQQEEMIPLADLNVKEGSTAAVPIGRAKEAISKEITWSSNADECIISYVARESGHRRPRLFYQLDNLRNIDFSKQFRGRPVRATDSEVEERWSIIKDMWKSEPSRYSKKHKTITDVRGTNEAHAGCL